MSKQYKFSVPVSKESFTGKNIKDRRRKYVKVVFSFKAAYYSQKNTKAALTKKLCLNVRKSDSTKKN